MASPDSPRKGHSLTFDQVQKLERVMDDDIPIRPASNFPEINVSPAGIAKAVRRRLSDRGIKLRDVRLNGSAASHCLTSRVPPVHYNDVDLIFGLEAVDKAEFHTIKEEVLLCLLDFLPKGTSKGKLSGHLMEETYVRKMVLITNPENQWSLISLGDGINKSIELKFVCKMKRQYEFTLDSFQIILDSYLSYHECSSPPSPTASQSFYPTVHAVSVYRDFDEALSHLDGQLIYTEAPEEIRGGGLLKYCDLLVRGYEVAHPDYMDDMLPYMCSRFFIDFPTVEQQQHKLEQYIGGRFLQHGDVATAIGFLDRLYHTVLHRSTCLMEIKRHHALAVIQHLRLLYCFFPNPYLPPPPSYGCCIPPAPHAPHQRHSGPPSPVFMPPPPPSIPAHGHFAFDLSRNSPPPYPNNSQHPPWFRGPTMPTAQVR